MENAQSTLYGHSENFAVNSRYYLGCQGVSELTGEVGSATYSTCHFYAISSNGPQESLHHSSRRSSHSYPYPTSLHDTTRSPTRSRFRIPASISPSSYSPCDAPLRSPSRTREAHPVVLGSDLRNRERVRHSQDEVVKNISQLSWEKNTLPDGPSNYILVPQAVFTEPVSSQLIRSRRAPVVFQVKGFPEIGIRVGSTVLNNSALLVGDSDPVFQDLQERELKIQINWPGYAPFQKRMKTANLPRGSVALKLAHIVLEFASHVQQTRPTVAPNHWQWIISDHQAGLGISVPDVFITKLIHRGGSHWQMELWTPRL